MSHIGANFIGSLLIKQAYLKAVTKYPKTDSEQPIPQNKIKRHLKQINCKQKVAGISIKQWKVDTVSY